MRLDGDLARWQRRAQAGRRRWIAASWAAPWRRRGKCGAACAGLDCSELAIALRDFHGAGPGVHVSEPTVYLHGAAALDNVGTLHLRDMQLRCATLAITSAQLRWRPDTGEAWGAVALRGNVGRLHQWLGDSSAAGPLDGELEGQVEFHPNADAMDYAFRGTVQGLLWNGEFLSPRGEPALTIRGRARLEPAADRLLLGPVSVDGTLGSITVQAEVANLSGSCDLHLRGECEYDLPRFAGLLDPALEVRIAGKDTRAFTLAGPLRPVGTGNGLLLRVGGGRTLDVPLDVPALHGQASFGLLSLKAPGCDIGPAELRLCLQQGWLQCYPLETTFNGGRLRVQPHLRLDPGPPEVLLLGGPVIEQARITPELCAGLLGQALPALGHVGQVEGTMSVILEAGRIPLADPSRAEIKGSIRLHRARFGPGPLSRELAAVLKTAPPACAVRDATVPFHLVHGRVYHRDLELTFPDFTIRTSGSVGLDGSLAMLVEMPLPVKLLGSAKVSRALAAQTIRLPIAGTVHAPHIDRQALQAISGQLLREIAADALEREVERKLRGLFRQNE